jgi:N-succinyldiaminopimelate aminotransferase
MNAAILPLNAQSAPVVTASNPALGNLQPYPFERLKALFAGVTPPPDKKPISLGIGEPQHPTPQVVTDTVVANLKGLASYPATAGSDALRNTIGAWLTRRYGLKQLQAAAHVLPVNGSREALFAFAQTVVNPGSVDHSQGDPSKRPSNGHLQGIFREGAKPAIVCPNPFYQIYEGAALLAGADTVFANGDPARNHAPDFASVGASDWARTQLVYVCSPGNPAGAVLSMDDWAMLFRLSDQHGFVIASDECYSEIYFDEANPPFGALQAAERLGRDYSRVMMFSSLSKRSNVPGMRSGFVAGDAALIKAFLLYRTYHGSAMSPTFQAASIAAWNDEAHVVANRALYREKFARVTPLLQHVLDVSMPDAGFYLWADVSRAARKSGRQISDTEFAQRLYAAEGITVLPGSYLARECQGINPGANRVRMALVAGVEECAEAAQRIVSFCNTL